VVPLHLSNDSKRSSATSSSARPRPGKEPTITPERCLYRHVRGVRWDATQLKLSCRGHDWRPRPAEGLII
jgi:hypothetical protein